NIDDLDSEERSVEKTHTLSIAKRLRSQTGKAVASVVPSTRTKKKSLKRKEPPSSDSDFEVEKDVLLVKEFLVNIGEDCDDPMSPEYRKVFVRGCCVDFSPSVINQYLGRSTKEVAELEATEDGICSTLTGNLIKKWPRKDKLSSTKLTTKYALLNKIAVVNWVPTTHSSDVATGINYYACTLSGCKDAHSFSYSAVWYSLRPKL
ncbi:envelope-like protein, partial [Trifolium medium]|nr:envelope-like protein [Trifolium medium]